MAYTYRKHSRHTALEIQVMAWDSHKMYIRYQYIAGQIQYVSTAHQCILFVVCRQSRQIILVCIVRLAAQNSFSILATTCQSRLHVIIIDRFSNQDEQFLCVKSNCINEFKKNSKLNVYGASISHRELTLENIHLANANGILTFVQQ